MKRELSSDKGAFYSAEDADSEGEEGKFYLWEIEEIKNILKDDADIIIDLYNVNLKGNYYDERTGEKTGKNILYLNQNNLPEKLEKEKELYFLRNSLYQAREKFVWRMIKSSRLEWII